MVSHKAIEDLKKDCECERTKYCPLESMLSSMDDRIAEQHKLVEFAKYKWGQLENKDIGWHEAYMRWVDLGYAKHFAKIYSPEKSYTQMRKEMFRI